MKRVETTDTALTMYRGKEINFQNSSKKLTAVNGDKVEISYSEKDHRISACIIDIKGDKKAVKSENMPREFRGICDRVTLSAFSEDMYVKTNVLSNGDVKLDSYGRLKGGMKEATNAVGDTVEEHKEAVGGAIVGGIIGGAILGAIGFGIGAVVGLFFASKKNDEQKN